MTAQRTLFDTIRDATTAATSTPPMPTWLVDQLTREGVLSVTGVTRTARPRTCSCGAGILVGLDADTCALEVQADPWPLSPLGEALALIEGRRTVTLNHEGRRWCLNERYDLQIAGWPAGTRAGEDVLRQHVHPCRPLSPAEMTGSMHLAAQVAPLPPNAPPPF